MPAEGVAWWNALPVFLTGSWKNKAGFYKWYPFKEGMDLCVKHSDKHELKRISNDHSSCLVLLKPGFKPPMKNNPDYYDYFDCPNCGDETKHLFHDSGHERDSSGDWRECCVCKWRYNGYSGKYSPPMK